MRVNLFKIILLFFQAFQKAILLCSYKWHKGKAVQKENGWVVAGVEVTEILANITKALPNSISVLLDACPYSTAKYDYKITQNTLAGKVVPVLMGPWLLGKLMHQREQFFYVGQYSFLMTHLGNREWEFGFLKRHGAKIVCLFLGTEIRSHRLMQEYSKEHDLDVVSTYQPFVSPGIDSEFKEQQRKLLAESAEKYADVIFNPQVDQMGYITRETLPFPYMISSEKFVMDESKFDDMERIVIFHAPSSPIIKGTPLVRAAIKKLKLEGYNIEYVECVKVSNDVVLAALRRAHIVLNQFYSLVPSVFGIEAMAHNCALLSAADPDREPTLLGGAAEAWKVTPYWMVYDNLKYLLDHPEEIKKQAVRGRDWTYKHYLLEHAAESLQSAVQE